MHTTDMGYSTALIVINVYGCQGSAQSTKNGANTDELLNVANQEMTAAGSGPMIILGHFNTDFDSSPATKRLTTLLVWIDAASPPPPINQKPPRSVLPNAAVTGESPAAPGRAQREPLDSGCLARHGASVGHTYEGGFKCFPGD